VLTHTPDNPTNINKFTGEPYQEEMDRLGFSEGGDSFIKDVIKDIGSKTVKEKYDVEKQGDGVIRNKNHLGFVRDIFLLAKQKGHPFPEAVATHAGYESRFGASQQAQEINNLFGLKKSSKVDEPFKVYRTREVDKDKKEYFVDSKFRVFNNIEDSYDGYIEHIDNRGKSKPHSNETPKEWRLATNSKEYYDAIQRDGYATEVSYGEKLLRNENYYKKKGVFLDKP